MAVNPDMVGLSQVTSGWTGTVQITRGVTTETITPLGRTSAIEVWAEVIRAAQVKFGGTWQGYPDSLGRLYITSTIGVFSVVVSGTTQTRLVYTGTYTGATEYTAAGAHHTAAYPTRGMRIDVDVAARSTRPPSASGSYGMSGAMTGPTGTMYAYGAYAELVNYESVLVADNTYDSWIGGRRMSRVRIGDVKRTRWGRLSTEALLEAGVMVVSR